MCLTNGELIKYLSHTSTYTNANDCIAAQMMTLMIILVLPVLHPPASQLPTLIRPINAYLAYCIAILDRFVQIVHRPLANSSKFCFPLRLQVSRLFLKALALNSCWLQLLHLAVQLLSRWRGSFHQKIEKALKGSIINGRCQHLHDFLAYFSSSRLFLNIS